MAISQLLAALAGLAHGGSTYIQDQSATERQNRLDAQNRDMALKQLQLATGGQQLQAQEQGFLPTSVGQEAQGAAQQNTANLGQLVRNPSANVGPGQDAISRLQNAITIGGTPYTRQQDPDALRQAREIERAKALDAARLKADEQKFTAGQNDLNRKNVLTAADVRAKAQAANQAIAPHYGTFDEPGADGTVQHRIVNMTGKDGEVVGDVQGKGKGTGSVQGSQVALGDAAEKHRIMTGLEGTPGFKVTGAQQLLGTAQYGKSLNAAHGQLPTTGQGIIAGGASLVGVDLPEPVAQYLDAGRAFGDEATKAFKGRQMEAAVAREIALSTVQPEDFGKPKVMGDKARRRAHILGMMILANPAQAANLPPGDAEQAMALVSPEERAVIARDQQTATPARRATDRNPAAKVFKFSDGTTHAVPE